MAIILEKQGDRHRFNLAQAGNSVGEMLINLVWSKSPSLFSRLFGADDIDLDLGCFYELRNGKKTLIDCLQFAHGLGGPRDMVSKQGCYTAEPYIWHSGDVRGDAADIGESILVNPQGLSAIKRIIIYTYIFDGATHWSDTNAVVKVKVPGCEELQVKLGRQQSNKRFCAIASINLNADNTMDVEKLLTFHDGHRDCDNAYHWGFAYHENLYDK